jgi:hypothetical protein
VTLTLTLQKDQNTTEGGEEGEVIRQRINVLSGTKESYVERDCYPEEVEFASYYNRV